MAGRRKRQAGSRGRRQVERERCHLQAHQGLPASPDEQRLADVLPGLMKRFGIEGAHWVSVLAEEWAALVGEAVATHTRPGRVDAGRLVVFVDSSVWLDELSRYGKGKMLENLQVRFGKRRIKSISLQLDPGDA